jgi:DNA-binding NtrC family response regulator
MSAMQQPILDGLRIVLLEGSVQDRLVFRQALEDCGATVETFGDADVVAGWIRVHRRDVVVANLHAPGDMVALARVIAALRLPAVLMQEPTGPDRAAEMAIAPDFRVDLRKPILPAILCQLVSEIVKRRAGGEQGG